jgi:hypothetical protein
MIRVGTVELTSHIMTVCLNAGTCQDALELDQTHPSDRRITAVADQYHATICVPGVGNHTRIARYRRDSIQLNAGPELLEASMVDVLPLGGARRDG